MSDQEKLTNLDQVRLHARQLVRELDVVKTGYMDTGLTLSQCHVLFELSENRSLSLMQLVDRLLIDKSNLSRSVKKLVDSKLVKSVKGSSDQRQKFFSLTASGKKSLKQVIGLAEHQIGGALDLLSQEQQMTVVIGLKLFESSLRKLRQQAPYVLRPIRKKDNTQLACVIRDVMTEFDAVGEGYSINDTEVDEMHENYSGKRRRYFVIVDADETVVGGGGVAQLRGGNTKTCEIRKMFFRPEIRGIGMGSRLLSLLLDQAKSFKFCVCYLETLERMESANRLYQRHGFEPIAKQMGNTGHDSCDRYYARKI